MFSEFAGGGRRRWSPKSTGTDLLGVKTRLCHIGRHAESLSTVCFIVDDPPARLLACVGRPRLLPFRGSAAGYVWFDFSSKRITIYLCTVPLCYRPASYDFLQVTRLVQILLSRNQHRKNAVLPQRPERSDHRWIEVSPHPSSSSSDLSTEITTSNTDEKKKQCNLRMIEKNETP